MADTTRDTLAVQAGYLIKMATRASSAHGPQPWRFTVSQDAIELYADPGRKLLADPYGRDMFISCGTALYGLRLAVRSLGYLPEVEYLPAPADVAGAGGHRPLARVRLGASAPMTLAERKMLAAAAAAPPPLAQAHRGPLESIALPAGLLAQLKDDVGDEGATLIAIDSARALRGLAAIVLAAGRKAEPDLRSRPGLRLWSHDASSPSRDLVPARACPAASGHAAAEPPRRDLGVGRGFGWPTASGTAAPVTLALFTFGDTGQQWLRTGQALQRLLARAASEGVSAWLNTRPLEEAAIRTMPTNSLIGPGSLQVLLELGSR